MNPWGIRTIFLLACGVGSAVVEGAATKGPVFSGEKSISQIFVQPEVTRYVEGVSILDRQKYFNLCDHGSDFDSRVSSDIYEELIENYGASFGRRLGGLSRWGAELEEDPTRPGFANLDALKAYQPRLPSSSFMEKCGPNLDVACHGNHNKYPAYMGKHFKGSSNYHGKPEWIPEKLDAAAMLAAAVLKYGYTDFDRPAYFEPLNEPHWEFWTDPHLVEWHLKTKEAVRRFTPEVHVGGPCLSVAYFYRDNYRLWKGMKYFMDETKGEMDFYSFHAYDFFKWNGNDFHGRIQSGLPLEGVLDLVQNYAVQTFGSEKEIVLSEHGGYVNAPGGMYDGELIAAELAATYFPGDTFELELKKRSIVNTLMLQAVVGNTLAFMDHPHVIRKAVPFIIPKSWAWDKTYYAQLYVPYEYTDTSRAMPTHLLNFFRFFRGVEGRRVKALSNDPDLQVRAFASGSELFLIVNNLSRETEWVDLKGLDVEGITLRRMGRHADFSGTYTEQSIPLPEGLQIRGLETVLLHADFGQPIPEKRRVYETVCYGDKVTVPLADATFMVDVPVQKKIDYAQVRVGLTRSAGLDRNPIITINGKQVEVPLEDCAERLEEKEYATTKIFLVNVDDLRARNQISITFADQNDGSVGSVVIRAAIKD